MSKIAALVILCAISFPAVAASDFFGQPQRLCSALAADGLRTAGWKSSKTVSNEWSCMTQFTPFGTAGSNGMENNISFYVNGTDPSRANDIRIKVNINNAKERTLAFSRLNSATKSLFKAISQPIPPDLSKAISQQKPIWISTSFGTVGLILKPGHQLDSFKVVLTVNSSPLKKQARNDSIQDLALCKTAIAKTSGYSASLLSGNGEPVQKSGYKSFLLKGQGKDLFFCEVYSDGHYKIKATLDDDSSFQYIAEGSFKTSTQ
jgi:hypothetical protein